MFRLLIASAVFALAAACGSDTPVPEYPFPRQIPLEDTDLAQYIGAGDEVGEEEEEWDDGLSDEDMQMGSPDSETETEEVEEEPEEAAADADADGD